MSSREVRTTPLPSDPEATAPADVRPARARRRGAVQAPLVLERYRLQRRLGAGAFGTVWMARDERLQRDVAVKLLARERIVGGRFEREARAAARLAHPGIVTLYEAAVDDEGAYLVSELVVGDTLGALLEAGRLSDHDVIAIGIGLCDALEHAHVHGVVHRDVKPSNVLVPDAAAGTGGDRVLAKLTDFGVARVIDSEALTFTGDVVGTLAYMAPEQAEGREVGGAADLYSLALVLYEALTGINPVRATTAFQRARRLGAHLPPLRRQRRDLPASLGAAIDAALRPRPRDRGTLSDLRDALRHARPDADDEPGIVAGAWASRPDPDDHELDPLGPRLASPAPGAELPEPAPLWVQRALAGAGAAAVAAWSAGHLLGVSAPPPAAVALVAAAAVMLFPRLGWLAVAVALCAGAAVGGEPGAALVLALALALPVLLLAARPAAWPLAAGAPALGLIGLAGAWPALASRGRGTVQRAALGAVGWLWLLVAGAALGPGRALYLPSVPGVGPPSGWMGSISAVTGHLLPALATSGALAPAVVWGLAAVSAPWMVHGRSWLLDVGRVIAWSALVLCATPATIAAVHGSAAPGSAPTALAGAAVGAAVVLAPRGAAGWRRAWRSIADAQGGFP